MVTPAKTIQLTQSKAPNLNNAPNEYSAQFENLLLNNLRLYFNQIDNITQNFVSGDFGDNVVFPFIAAGDVANQYATANNTPTIVQWNLNYGSTGFTLNADNTATSSAQSYFKITYSIQFANTDNAPHDAIVWLRVNGVDVAGSTSIFTVPARKSAGVPSFVTAYSEVVFDLEPGDSVGLWWGTDTAATAGGGLGVYMYFKAAQTTPMAYPSTPSAIGSITFLSRT
jgi:hypothetical protein